jgi:transcriptional regulator with PAS, ATPase and Fis domain
MILDDLNFHSDYFNNTTDAILLLAKNERSILIIGESGTGKSLIYEKIKSFGFHDFLKNNNQNSKILAKNPSNEDLYYLYNTKSVIIFYNLGIYKNLEENIKSKIDEKISDKVILEPLRERKSEIIINLEKCKLNFKFKMEKAIEDFLINYSYPGNHEHWKLLLQYIISHPKIKNPSEIPYTLIESYSENSDILIPGKSMQSYEKEIIKMNLNFFKNNRKKTAESLGISERNLYRKIILHKL